ncbi:hypothetical protein [Terrimonas alba]|uniref:hypothetical protein n=1 Tax=Terrimonas alba TaxID=3349636 RepID=UPI0035F276E6
MSALPPFLIKLEQQLKDAKTKQAAWDIINEYFSFFDMTGINKELWMLTVGTLTNEEMEVQNVKDRHNIIFFYEYTRLFYQAVFLLYNKYNKIASPINLKP